MKIHQLKKSIRKGSNKEVPGIYLFCNHGFGLPFAETALWCLKDRAKLTIVYSSGYRKRENPGLAEYSSQLKYYLLDKYVHALSKVTGAKVVTVTDVNSPDFLDRIPPCSHGIVAGFNQIFGCAAISSFHTLVNFHPSILPFYRGPVPSYWVLRNREQMTGYTLHRITQRIDSGEVLFQHVIACDQVRSDRKLNQNIALAAQTTFGRYLANLLGKTEWEVVKVDAQSVYRVHVDYARRPEVANRRQKMQCWGEKSGVEL